MPSNHRGFTFIEMAAVITIIGILSAIFMAKASSLFPAAENGAAKIGQSAVLSEWAALKATGFASDPGDGYPTLEQLKSKTRKSSHVEDYSGLCSSKGHMTPTFSDEEGSTPTADATDKVRKIGESTIPNDECL